jgi:hypothetical protein
MVLDGLFESWKRDLNENFGKAKYLSRTREEALQDLVDRLVEDGVPYEDALGLRFKIKEALVTKKGFTGAGNYKGWKECVENDFKRIMYETYKENNILPVSELQPQKEIVNNSNNLQSEEQTEIHPLVDFWGQRRFGSQWCEDLRVLANTPDTSLHNLFLDEMFS